MTMVEAAVLFGFGVPIVAACMAFVVMACRMQNEENAKLAAQQKEAARRAEKGRRLDKSSKCGEGRSARADRPLSAIRRQGCKAARKAGARTAGFGTFFVQFCGRTSGADVESSILKSL